MLVVVVVFPHWRLLLFWATFPCHRHSTLASQAHECLQRLWALPWLLPVALLFARLFPSEFYHECYGFQWTFFTHRRFLAYASSATFLEQLLTQMRAGARYPASSSVPALTELSLPAGVWTWTIDVGITRPLIYQLHQWATKYRVKIELLNIFRLFIWNSFEKTIKTLWTRLDVLLKTPSTLHQSYFKKAATRKAARCHIK